jgi:hypothetical protein
LASEKVKEFSVLSCVMIHPFSFICPFPYKGSYIHCQSQCGNELENVAWILESRQTPCYVENIG